VDGRALPASMGIETRLHFQAVGNGKVAAAGSFVLVASELPRVVYALRSGNIEITALSGHMLGELPRLFYLYFFAAGTPEGIARTVRAAIYRTDSGKGEQSRRGPRFRLPGPALFGRDSIVKG
jgi:hypothetical protein